MSFLNKIKSFLGLQTKDNDRNLNFVDEGNGSLPSNSLRDEIIRHEDNINEYKPDHFDTFGFNVFSNPVEIHRYFEHQMNEMMRSFGMFGNQDFFYGGNGDPFFEDGTFDLPHIPAIQDHEGKDLPQRSLREQYLKPGFEQPKMNEQHKADKDLDGHFNVGDLGSIFKGTPSEPQTRTYFYGQSVSTKTIRRPDGVIETQQTFRDKDGNEETKIIRKQGDKEYSITTRTDKSGQKEVIENLVNMDESEKDTFLRNIEPYKGEPPQRPSTNWFPFDKFF